MDFFTAQDLARRNTWRLALLFGAAVLCLILLTNLLIAFVFAFTTNGQVVGLATLVRSLPAEYWLWTSVVVIGVVALASGFKYLQVRGGGRAVAEALGGRLVSQSTEDPGERRLLNVVEEMAIASAVPVPPVYVLEEPSINAFAAGFTPDDAVVGVNRGTLNHLTRAELQGVIAHEFSHILNGDSRINVRLLAVLHGILFISMVGHALLRGAAHGAGRRRGSSGGAPVLALGVGLLAIGYAGSFFGGLIKSAVSRQREYLADAASVQFTRDPQGIAGALKKIGALAAGSAMSRPAAKEASHMFFGDVGRAFLGGLAATHPPLERRIRAVDPGWDGRFPVLAGGTPATDADTPVPAATGVSAGAETAGAHALAGVATSGFAASPPTAPPGADDRTATAERFVDAVGRLDDAGLAEAQTLIDSLPVVLREAAHDPFAGRAMVYGLVLEAAGPVRDWQLGQVEVQADRGVAEELQRLLPHLIDLDENRKLVLVELVMPALKELSEPQYRRFTRNLVSLIKADRRIDLMEWVLHRLLLKELAPHFEGPRRRPVRYRSLHPVAAEAAVLISALAREAGPDPTQVAGAFAAGLAALEMPGTLDAEEDPNFGRLNRALAELQALQPLAKPRLIKACAATVLADGRVPARQRALLRGLAAALDCPLPPSIR